MNYSRQKLLLRGVMKRTGLFMYPADVNYNFVTEHASILKIHQLLCEAFEKGIESPYTHLT